ncbi:MFS transporter [Pseudonocardia endophytica]|uniref:EmrB/QacA subfamily drug resistance transporter n=1 Tax=Pseudonocardia endophytica TaxID=401976 RepID=A0A4R1HTG2_PSEEN|nr:EmrB/QacA subfamily drug resistance transporter [Pseudonocardia endophytica]
MSRPTARTSALVPVLALGGITVSLQQTTVVPLVPQFPALLNAPAADTAWVVTSTLLAAAVATPVVGRLADMFGKRRMLLFCVAVLVAGSVVSGLSSSLIPMVVGRALQGLAVGVIPLGISLMRDALPPEKLGSATALMSASLGVGGALGLPLAALVAQYADWHWLFWGSGALGAMVFVAVLAIVPESPQRTGGRFDVLGALLLAVALVCLLLAVSKGGTWGWGSPTTLGLFGGFVVALVLFGLWEVRNREPLVDLRVTRRRQVLLTNIASIVMGFSMFAMSLVFPQLLQLPLATGYGLGQSIVVAGLVLAPGGLCMIAMSPLSARISAASGPRTTLMIGAAVVAVGYVVGALFHSAIWQLVVSAIVISSGIGLAYGAMPSLVMAAVPVTQTAAANSLNNLMRAIGTSTASAVAGVLLAQLTTRAAGVTVPSENAFLIVMVLGAGAAVVAVVITAFIPRRPPVDAAVAVGTPEPATADAPGADGAGHAPGDLDGHPVPVGAAEPAGSPRVPARTADVVAGVVRYAGAPADDAVVTVVRSDGRQLGRGRTDRAGSYAIELADTGTPHLLVLRWDGRPHVEYLGPTRSQARDVDLDDGHRLTRGTAALGSEAGPGPEHAVDTERHPART